MQVILLFVVLVFGLDAIGVMLCSVIERTSSFASLIAFLGFFVVNFVIAWKIAIFVYEKYLVSDAQKQANDEHVRWVSSLFPARR